MPPFCCQQERSPAILYSERSQCFTYSNILMQPSLTIIHLPNLTACSYFHFRFLAVLITFPIPTPPPPPPPQHSLPTPTNHLTGRGVGQGHMCSKMAKLLYQQYRKFSLFKYFVIDSNHKMSCTKHFQQRILTPLRLLEQLSTGKSWLHCSTCNVKLGYLI